MTPIDLFVLAGAAGALAGIDKAVSIFGSARTQPDEGAYELARATARRLGEAGFAIITGVRALCMRLRRLPGWLRHTRRALRGADVDPDPHDSPLPVLLTPSAPWRGLLAWLEEEALAADRVAAADLALLLRCDEPADVVRLTERAHAAQARAVSGVGGYPPVAVPTPEP